MLSGSWPGEIYLFRRTANGSFAAAEQLKDRNGKALNLGHASAAFAADWDGNGTLDLLVGNVLGEVHVVPNEGKALAFGSPRRLETNGQPIKVNGDAAPVVADWDGDGKLDLIVGAEDGSVVWYRNLGRVKEPKLDAARILIGKSPIGWGNDDKQNGSDWGLRVKPCVVDWDEDGRLDILLGDRCGGFQAKPSQTEQERVEEWKAHDKLPELRTQWAATYRDYRRLADTPAGEISAERERTGQLEALRDKLRRLKEEMVVVQEIESRYRPEHQSHGFVWLFLRKPAIETGTAPTKGPRP